MSWMFLITMSISVLGASIPAEISYLYPRPGSRFVSPQATLLLRFHPQSARVSFLDSLFQVVGDRGGYYAGSCALADDGWTIMFKPHKSFQPNERIRVGIDTESAGNEPFQYEFVTSGTMQDTKEALNWGKQCFPEAKDMILTQGTMGRVQTINGVTVPSDFPRIRVSKSATNSPGYLFFGLRHSYFMILKNDGTPYFYHKSNDFLMDFKVLPNGYLSRTVDNWDTGERFYVTMNPGFTPADTFAAQWGYYTDHHDFQLLPNGHALLIVRDSQTIDMSAIIPGGKKAANVQGCHIQELDRNKNVIFHWSCWDYLDVTEANHMDLTDQSIDYIHMNSISVDYDGHLLASCRNTSQCLKIDRQSGEIIWRLGGVKNQFQFIDNAEQNSYQHHFRAVPGVKDHYTLFDNGNYHIPGYSRAVEFKVDVEEKTVETVWQYRNKPSHFSGWLGSVQRLANGNTLINWAYGGVPFAHEVTPSGETVYQADSPEDIPCYRCYRFEWQGIADRPYLLLEPYENWVTLIFNKFGDDNVAYFNIYTGPAPISMTLMDTTSQTKYEVTDLANHQRHYFKVTAVSKSGEESLSSGIEAIDIDYRDSDTNIVLNGDFAAELHPWEFVVHSPADARAFINDGMFKALIHRKGDNTDDIQLYQTGIPLYIGQTYQFEFDAYALAPREIEAKIVKAGFPYTDYSRIGFTALTSRPKHYSHTFEMNKVTDLSAKLVFNCGGSTANVYLDNVIVKRVVDTEIEDHSTVPHAFEVEQNYPNPFNGVTRIGVHLPEAGEVKLTIYNVWGQQVHEQNGFRQAGHHLIAFDADRLPSGLYVYQCEYIFHGDVKQSMQNKMVLMR